MPCSDYRAMPQLDNFDQEGIDDEGSLDEVSAGEAEERRQAAERALQERDRREHGDLPGAFAGASLCMSVIPFAIRTRPSLARQPARRSSVHACNLHALAFSSCLGT